VLNELADGVDARGPGQLVELGELRSFLGREQTRDREAALRLCAGQRIRLMVRHEDIMEEAQSSLIEAKSATTARRPR
jgi:hypothetical protein